MCLTLLLILAIYAHYGEKQFRVQTNFVVFVSNLVAVRSQTSHLYIEHKN